MSNADVVRAVLDECFPNECDIVGPSNLEEILKGSTEVVRTKYGSSMDLTSALMMLIGAVAFAGDAIAVYEFWMRSRTAPPSTEELEEAVSRDAKVPVEIDKEGRCRICEVLLPLLRERMGRGDSSGLASASRSDAGTPEQTTPDSLETTDKSQTQPNA